MFMVSVGKYTIYMDPMGDGLIFLKLQHLQMCRSSNMTNKIMAIHGKGM